MYASQSRSRRRVSKRVQHGPGTIESMSALQTLIPQSVQMGTSSDPMGSLIPTQQQQQTNPSKRRRQIAVPGTNAFGSLSQFGANPLTLQPTTIPINPQTLVWNGIRGFGNLLNVGLMQPIYSNLMIQQMRLGFYNIMNFSPNNWNQTLTQGDSLLQNEILHFSSNTAIDQYAQALSPDLVSIELDTPVHASYPSPTHFVESMKLLSLGRGYSNLRAESDPACSNAILMAPALAMQPFASIIRSASTRACPDVGWFNLEAEHGRFWAYLWIALWAKYKQNPAMREILRSTGTKMLFFRSTSLLYGVHEMNTTGSNRMLIGLNAVGILLMFMRALINAGWMDSGTEPSTIFKTYMLPSLAYVLMVPGPEFPFNLASVTAFEMQVNQNPATLLWWSWFYFRESEPYEQPQ